MALLLVFTVVMAGCSGTNHNTAEIAGADAESDVGYPLQVEYAHWAGENSKKGEYTVYAAEGLEFNVDQRVCDLIVIVEKVSDEKIVLKCHYSDDEKKIMTVRLKKGESKTLDTPTMDSGGRVTFTFGKID